MPKKYKVDYEKSLLGLIEKHNRRGIAEWEKEAKKGKIMRIM